MTETFPPPGGPGGSRARRLRVRALAAPALALFAAGCAELPVAPGGGDLDIDLALPWDTAAPSAVGGSPELVARALERAAANSRLRSLLVVKDGKLVVEEYFGGADRDDLHDVRSVTKSVVSALAGIALQRGEIGSLDDPVADYLAPLVTELDPAKRAITVRHLLTMTSGIEWDETGGFGSYSDWIRSGDHLRHLLDKPMAARPGAEFVYNSAAVHLLGVVVEQAAGMPLPDFSRFALFDRIGVSPSRWEPLGGGYHNGGAGLDLAARDLARFGQLFLQRGSSGGRRIVSEEWVELSTAERFDWRIDLGSLRGISYGHLWWVVPGAPEPLYFAWGYGGQFVVVAPRLRLVAVATSDWYGVSRDGGAGLRERATMNVIVEDLIPAFR